MDAQFVEPLVSTILQPALIEAAQRFVLHDVTWSQYVQIVDGLGVRPSVRTSYDGGSLELMTTSRIHEWYKNLLGLFLHHFTLERGIAIANGGEMTFRRADLARGLEPDNCYWITHEKQLRRIWEPDFTSDPPPDLCVEIEVSRTVVDRLGIYADLGVPEVWRFDGRTLGVLRLSEGAYVEIPDSVEIPGFPADEVVSFLDPNEDVDDNTRTRRFVEFVRAGSAE